MFSRALSTSIFARRLQSVLCPRSRISTYPDPEDKEQVTVTDDGAVIVCWHPEKPFPYDCSKPLPEAKASSNSIFKIDNKEEVYKIFKDKKEEFVREELMKITYTTKHIWFPRARSKKNKKTVPNRPYL